MVNPAAVQSVVGADLDVLPPAAQHRAYSTPHIDQEDYDTPMKGTDDGTTAKPYDEYTEKAYGAEDGGEPGEPGVIMDGTPEDRERVQKVARTSSWLSTFFLITTDVLGPSVAPWAMSVLGWVPGALIFFFLGVVATYTGLILLNLFVKLDTPEQPVRTFSDLSERIAGYWGPTLATVVRHVVAVLQAIQLLMAVAVLIFGNAIVLSQLINFSICFVDLLVIFAVIGNVGGLIKSFKNLSYFANFSVWINLAICFLCMGVAGSTGAISADGTTVYSQSDIQTLFPTQVFGSAQFYLMSTAISNVIYAYGGATMYVELMSEMKNPREFWKSLFCAEFIIIGCYFLFGLYYYSEMGQLTEPIPQSTLNNLSAQQAANSMGLFTGIVAAVMYGNVGLKVVYYQIVVDLCKGPQLTTRRGTVLWSCMVTVYWWVAFVIAGAVPNIQSIVGIVGALCIMQFTYTFPPLMQFLYYWQQGTTMREKLLDKWWLKSLDMVICLGSLAATGIGMWGSITSMIEVYQAGPSPNGFGCVNPQYGV